MTPTRRIRIAAAALLLQLTTLPSLALDAAREDVRVFVDDMERAHGLDRAWVGKLTDSGASQPRIIELMSRPAERTKPWHEYRDHFLTEARIAAGAGFWAEHRQRLAEVEAATGVPAHVIVGILGVETFYGRITGNFRVLDALSTLAFDYPPRSSYFRGELEQFLLLSREEDVPPLTVKGSYAGAMGYPQFMPRSYRAYAVDGDGDGRRDLWNSWDDVIASIANYLAAHGWRGGEPVLAAAEEFFRGELARSEPARSYVARRRVSWVEGEGRVAEKARDGFTRGVVSGLVGMALAGLCYGASDVPAIVVALLCVAALRPDQRAVALPTVAILAIFAIFSMLLARQLDAAVFGEIGIGAAGYVLAVNPTADGYIWIPLSATSLGPLAATTPAIIGNTTPVNASTGATFPTVTSSVLVTCRLTLSNATFWW